jgi:hypothetical protein
LIEDTIASDNQGTGIVVNPSAFAQATLSRITANNNFYGVVVGHGNATVANSVISNNSTTGLVNGGATWLAKTVISGSPTGVNVVSGTANSYGDNYLNNNTFPLNGSLTPVSMQ